MEFVFISAHWYQQSPACRAVSSTGLCSGMSVCLLRLISENTNSVCTPRLAYEIACHFCKTLLDSTSKTPTEWSRDILEEVLQHQNDGRRIENITGVKKITFSNYGNLQSAVNRIAYLKLTSSTQSGYCHAGLFVLREKEMFLFDANRGAILVELKGEIGSLGELKNTLKHVWNKWSGPINEDNEERDFTIYAISDIKNFDYLSDKSSERRLSGYLPLTAQKKWNILSHLFYPERRS